MVLLDIRLEESRGPPSQDLRTVRVRVSCADLGGTMKKIRTWLDHHKVQPACFRTTADPRGYLLTLEFRTEEIAERFRQQF